MSGTRAASPRYALAEHLDLLEATSSVGLYPASPPAEHSGYKPKLFRAWRRYAVGEMPLILRN